MHGTRPVRCTDAVANGRCNIDQSLMMVMVMMMGMMALVIMISI